MKVCAKCGRELPEEMFHRHKATKDGLQTQCKECQIKYNKKYREEHKEEIKKYRQKYREENKEEIKERDKKYREEHKEYYKEYYKEHKEEIREYRKKYYQEYKEETKRYSQKYNQEHKEEKREYDKKYKEEKREYYKKYREEHKEYHKEYDKKYLQTPRGKAVKKAAKQNRRVRKKNNGGSFTVDEWLEVCEKFNNECAYCGKNDVKLTADHIVPVSKGGHGNIDNIIPVCKSCNSSKHNASLTDWYPAQSFFTAERYQKIIEHAHLK